MLIAPLYKAIGLWTAGYVLLSLSLAAIWIALVSFGRFYQRRWKPPVLPTRSRLPVLTPGFHHWQSGNEEFSRQLGRLEDGLLECPMDSSTGDDLGVGAQRAEPRGLAR
jgi:hypothetical protein